jgi:hypothetical protein
MINEQSNEISLQTKLSNNQLCWSPFYYMNLSILYLLNGGNQSLQYYK